MSVETAHAWLAIGVALNTLMITAVAIWVATVIHREDNWMEDEVDS